MNDYVQEAADDCSENSSERARQRQRHGDEVLDRQRAHSLCIVIPTSRDCLQLFLIGVLKFEQQFVFERGVARGEFCDGQSGCTIAKPAFKQVTPDEC